MPKGPASVLMYRLIYNEGGASFAYWDGGFWTATGEVHDVESLHKQLEHMGAVRSIKESFPKKVMEIWTIGG